MTCGLIRLCLSEAKSKLGSCNCNYNIYQMPKYSNQNPLKKKKKILIKIKDKNIPVN